MKKNFLLSTFVRSLSVSLAVFLLMGCEKKGGSIASEAEAIPVRAQPVMVKDLTLYVESIGSLQAPVSIQVRPQVTGQIAKVFVREGEWVKPGTPLFEIERDSYANKVQEGEAQLGIDLAVYEAAQKKLHRYQQLARKDLVAQTEWDDLKAEAERLQGVIQLDEVRLSASRLDFERCTIVSPVDGRMGKLDFHPGMLVAGGQGEPLATIVQLDPLMVEFSITEKEFPKMPREHAGIDVIPLCTTGNSMQGTVAFVDNQFNPETGLLLIRGSIPNPDHTLRPGQSVKVKLPVSVVSNARLIPQKAIRYNQEGPYAYIVQADGTVALRPLILGSEQGENQVVLEGIDRNEVVVSDGHLRLSPGVKVEVKS